ncbi:MAG: M48 family metalloprotease [bacterium]
MNFVFQKKIIFFTFLAFFIISCASAEDCILPSHEDIKTEVNILISQDKDMNLLHKVKKYILGSNGYIKITSQNAPNIFKLLKYAEKIANASIPKHVYINTSHSDYANWNAFVASTKKGVIYLSLGSEFLKELTPKEIKAVLEHEFGHLRQDYLNKVGSLVIENVCKNKKIMLSLVGAWIILYGLMINSLCNQEYYGLFVQTGAVYPLWCLSKRIFKNKIVLEDSVCKLSRELERDADLHVSSKLDLASSLKKILAKVLEMEVLKHNPFMGAIKDDLDEVLIKGFESGKLDTGVLDPLHPPISERLKYLQEAFKDYLPVGV